MPFTRCSRASSSTSRLAVLLVARGRCFLGSGRIVLGGRRSVRGGGVLCGSVLGGRHLGRSVLGGSNLGGSVVGGRHLGRSVLGGSNLGRSVPGGSVLGGSVLGGLARVRPSAVRLGRLAGRRLGVLRLRGVRRGGGLAGLALVRLGLGRLQRLGNRRGEGFLLVRLGRSGLQRALGPGQALELLPVTGDLKDPPDRVRGLRTHREPMLCPLRVDRRRNRLGVRPAKRRRSGKPRRAAVSPPGSPRGSWARADMSRICVSRIIPNRT